MSLKYIGDVDSFFGKRNPNYRRFDTKYDTRNVQVTLVICLINIIYLAYLCFKISSSLN